MSKQLSEKEQLVIELIQQDPYISQQELANHLNVSRPTVANMISSLMKRGHIVGRAYVLADDEPIICIGGANVDRKYYLKEKAKMGTSNPTKSSQTAGGVARNIAENLGRLGLEVNLLTCCGDDSDWRFIEEVTSPYVNVDYVNKSSDASTGSYTAVIDATGEMILALADMEVYETITPDFLQKQESLLMRSRCIVADLNLPKETLTYLSHFAETHEKPFIIIAVSAPKMSRLPSDLKGVTWLITNRDESEAYYHNEIQNDDDWRQAVQKWLKLGVQNITITNGRKGAMMGNDKQIIHIPAIDNEKIVDVTGAGDAFSSAVIYSWLQGNDLMEIGKAGSINAYKTLQSPYTVRQDLSASKLKQDMEEL